MEVEIKDPAIVGDINRLPEECISHVISLTRPRDACASSAVSRTFLSAADSDATWQRFVPSDHDSLLSQAVDPVEYASKKELYFRLCDHPVLIDGGKMSFGLEKSSGAKCFMISARALSIVWGNDERYWDWVALPDSRFPENAELLEVCWLAICGNMDSKILTPHTAYSTYFVFKLRHDTYGLGNPLQETSVTLGGDMVSQHEVCLHPKALRRRRNHPLGENVKVPRERGDGWIEVEMGEFYSGDGDNGEISMSFKEIEGGNWKKGLIVEGIEVRPRH